MTIAEPTWSDGIVPGLNTSSRNASSGSETGRKAMGSRMVRMRTGS